LRVRARLYARPRGLGPGLRDRGGVLRSRLRARRPAAALRDLGDPSAEHALAPRRRTLGRARRRTDGRGRPHVGSLGVAARDLVPPCRLPRRTRTMSPAMATVTVAFPTGVLFDVMMRGGPLPARYASLGGQLVRPGPLDFTPDEAIAIRDWLSQ